MAVTTSEISHFNTGKQRVEEGKGGEEGGKGEGEETGPFY